MRNPNYIIQYKPKQQVGLEMIPNDNVCTRDQI